MRHLPAIDLHAHVETRIEEQDLVQLDAVVFAVTRSLDEARTVVDRRDRMAVWGVGCHPGLLAAQKTYSTEVFERLIDRTALAGELGLDGRSRVPMDVQRATFISALQVLRDKPRITTIHSYAACEEVLAALVEVRPIGAVLHWWLGTADQTTRALDLGCFFSVNAAMLKHREWMKIIPLDRLLTETDHPFGDRSGGAERRPGCVGNVEAALARAHSVMPTDIRRRLWFNLRTLALEASVGALLPAGLRKQLASL